MFRVGRQSVRSDINKIITTFVTSIRIEIFEINVRLRVSVWYVRRVYARVNIIYTNCNCSHIMPPLALRKFIEI